MDQQKAITSWDAPSRFGAVGLAARGALRRALRPVLMRQAQAADVAQQHLVALRARVADLERELADVRELTVPGAERTALFPVGPKRREPSTKVLCSLAVGPYVDLLAVSSVSYEAYAARHGYDLALSTQLPDPTRPPSWNKLMVVRELLERYELVLWIDPDASFVDIDVDLADELRPGKDLYMVEHRWPDPALRSANAGVFLLRRGEWARDLIDAAWAMEKYVTHPWWENAALLELLGYEVPEDLTPPRPVRETVWSARLQLLGLEWNSTAGMSVAEHPRIRHHGRPTGVPERRALLAEDLRALRRRLAQPPTSGVGERPVERDLA